MTPMSHAQVTTVAAMVKLSKSCDRKIYIRAEGKSGVLGVFEIYPGGRTIFWSSDKGRIYERKLSEALQDVVFAVKEARHDPDERDFRR